MRTLGIGRGRGIQFEVDSRALHDMRPELPGVVGAGAGIGSPAVTVWCVELQCPSRGQPETVEMEANGGCSGQLNAVGQRQTPILRPPEQARVEPQEFLTPSRQRLVELERRLNPLVHTDQPFAVGTAGWTLLVLQRLDIFGREGDAQNLLGIESESITGNRCGRPAADSEERIAGRTLRQNRWPRACGRFGGKTDGNQEDR